MNATRVSVVDDHALFAEAMVVALGYRGYDARCVVPMGETATGASLAAQVLAGRPDVVLCDLGIAGDSLDLIDRLSSRFLVVVVSGVSDPARIGAALAAGATTVISKSLEFEKILDTLVRLRDGLSGHVEAGARTPARPVARRAGLRSRGQGAVRPVDDQRGRGARAADGREAGQCDRPAQLCLGVDRADPGEVGAQQAAGQLAAHGRRFGVPSALVPAGQRCVRDLGAPRLRPGCAARDRVAGAPVSRGRSSSPPVSSPRAGGEPRPLPHRRQGPGDFPGIG